MDRRTVEPDRKWSFNRWWLGVSRASSADQGWENRVSRAGKQFRGRRHQSTISMSLAVCCALISSGCVYVAPGSTTIAVGCMDKSAVNYDVRAETTDGSCKYSLVVFYASADEYEYVPDQHVNQLFIVSVERITIRVDGITQGELMTHHPEGPERCLANGTVSYEFDTGDAVKWDSKIELSNGHTLRTSGIASPSRLDKCIFVDVTASNQ